VPTQKELLADLERVANKIGHLPAASDYRERGNYSVSAFYTEFGSWEQAKERTDIHNEKTDPRKVSADELLKSIRSVDERSEEVPTKSDYEEYGKYSVSTVYRRFDSWTDAREAAGISEKPTPHNKISREELIKGLRSFATKRDSTPTRDEMNGPGPYSGSAYQREFGSWNKALKAAGLALNQPTDAEETDVDCEWCGTEMIREVAQIQDQNHVFCCRYCKARFQESDEWGGTDHPLSNRVEIECANCGQTLRRKPSHVETRDRCFCGFGCMGDWMAENQTGDNNPRWKGGGRLYYGPNWHRQRRKRRKKDGYVCQWCGLGDEESIERFGRELSVHHRQPMRTFVEDGETDYERANRVGNLVTLCIECHKKIEKLPVQPHFE
jgi:hypothetical protein